MKTVGETTWEDVFSDWEKRETSDPGWIECATKIKGWSDWKSWREFTAMQLELNKKIWRIAEFENPFEEIPEMLVGPFTGWQKRHPNTNLFTFSDLLDVPEEFEHWSNLEKIQDLIRNFPSETQFIGLVRKDINKIVCIEGHHRAVAFSMAKKLSKEFDLGKNPTIALADLPESETYLLQKALERGSAKEPV